MITVKNPARVPDISQVADPVGRDPEGAGPRVIPEVVIMPKIEETGVYKRKSGGPHVLLKKGDELTPEQFDDLELVEASDKSKGAPEKRDEKAAEKPAKAEKGKAE